MSRCTCGRAANPDDLPRHETGCPVAAYGCCRRCEDGTKGVIAITHECGHEDFWCKSCWMAVRNYTFPELLCDTCQDEQMRIDDARAKRRAERAAKLRGPEFDAGAERERFGGQS